MQVLQASKKGVRCVSFSPSGDSLAAGGYDAAIRLWTTADGTHRKLTSGGHTPRCLAWTADGTRMAVSGGPDGTLFWCGIDGGLTHLSAGGFGTCCLSPDGHTLYAAAHSSIRRWDTGLDREVEAWPAWSPAQLATSADGKWLASTHPLSPIAGGNHPHHVAVRDAWSGEVVKQIEWPPDFAAAVAFSPDGTRLAVVRNQSLSLWEWPSGKVVREYRSPRKFLTAGAFSPDGRTFATTGNDTLVRFWDATDGRMVKEFDWMLGKALCVAFAPDGLRAAAGGEFGRIVVWDVE